MAYIGFDLDETLGTFVDISIFTFLLDSVPTEIEHPSPELQEKIERAFDAFAKCLVERDHVIGILRPGIMDIAKRLQELKDEDKVKKIVIYSNNANPTSLRLAAKMISYGIGRSEDDFFCNLIHWDHPIRLEPHEKALVGNNPVYHSKWLMIHGSEVRRDRPGFALKSTRTLKRAFESGKCAAENVDPTDFFFFDDLIHQNILKTISADHYFHVNKYQRSVDFKQLLECFMKAIQSEGLDTNEEYIAHVSNILGVERTDIASMIKTWEESHPRNKGSFYQYWDNDTDRILKRLDALFGPSTPVKGKRNNLWNNSNYKSLSSNNIPSGTPIYKSNINNLNKSILGNETNIESENEGRGTAAGGGKRKKIRKTRKQSHRKKRATRRR